MYYTYVYDERVFEHCQSLNIYLHIYKHIKIDKNFSISI